jgi:hypothetical protein
LPLYVWAGQWSRARSEPDAAITALRFVAFAVMSAPADMLYQRTFWLSIGATLALKPRPTGTASTG